MFNQTTKLISLKSDLNTVRKVRPSDDAVKEVTLPKNLDKMALQYQFTSGNRVNAVQNVRTRKE